MDDFTRLGGSSRWPVSSVCRVSRIPVIRVCVCVCVCVCVFSLPRALQVGLLAPRGRACRVSLRGPHQPGSHLLPGLHHPAALHDPRGPPGHLHRQGTLTVTMTMRFHYRFCYHEDTATLLLPWQNCYITVTMAMACQAETVTLRLS